MESGRLIFVDEFGVHLAMTRTHARAPQGQRAAVCETFERGTKMSALSALGMRGVFAPMVIEGAIDQLVFDQYVESMLVPHLLPQDRVMLDNISFHSSPRANSLIEAAGARVEHFPAYSPDFNPLEECISKIKTTLRQLKPETERALLNSLAFALDQISSSDILGWFKHCGYHT
jgi:transposase